MCPRNPPPPLPPLRQPQLPCRFSAQVGSRASVLSGALCGTNVAESEDELDPEFDDRFIADFVAKRVVDFVVRTGVVVLTFV
jgi:hypothetical protein